MNIKIISFLGLLSVAACTGTVEIPNASVARSPDGTVTRMTGMIQGSLVGSSPVSMKSVDSDLTCAGDTNSNGIGSMQCSDGSVIAIEIPEEKYGTFSGTYSGTLPDGTVYVSGWGQFADIQQLEAALEGL